MKDKKTISDKPEENQEPPYALATAGAIISNPFRGTLIIGGAGSGKSKSIFSPMIADAVKKNYCGILYDFKFPQLSQELYASLKNCNGESKPEFHCINFENLNCSSRLNPLQADYIINSSYAREYAGTILNNTIPESIIQPSFWTRTAVDLFSAIIYFNAKECPEYSTLPHAIAMTLQNEEKLIKTLCINRECAGMVRSIQTAILNKAGGQLSGVLSTLQSGVSILNTPEIFYVLSGNDFSLDLNNPAKPVWLALGNSPIISQTYAPII